MQIEKNIHISSNSIALLEHVRTPIIVFQNYKVQYVNSALCELFEKRAIDFIAISVHDLLHERCCQQVIHWMDCQTDTSDCPFQIDLQLSYPQNSETENNNSEKKFRWMNGKLLSVSWKDKLAVVAFLVDIEEKKTKSSCRRTIEAISKNGSRWPSCWWCCT